MDQIPGRQARPAVRPEVRTTDSVQSASAYSQPSSTGRMAKPKRRSKLWYVIGAILALVLIAGIAFTYLKSTTVPGVDGGKYQAVFLTNGQVYFGKLSSVDGNYYKLTNIFYLQAGESSANSDNPQDAAKSQNANVKLIKLGSEVHGPEDAMVIGKDQLLFFENLKDDGKVSSTIKEYAKNNNK